MPSTQQGARASRPKWDLSFVPHPCRPAVVDYLKKVERAHRKSIALKKVTWVHEHSYERKSTLFRDVKNVVRQVVDEEAQRRIHDGTFKIKCDLIQKEIDESKKDSNESFAAAKKKLEDYKASLAKVTNDWIIGDHAGDIFRAAVEQISEVSVNIGFRLDVQYDRWVERQKAKSLKKKTEVLNTKLVKEAFVEDAQCNKPIAEQISDLRLALQQVLGSSSHGPKNVRRPPHGGGSRSGSNTSARSKDSNRRRSSSGASAKSNKSNKSALSHKSNKSNKSTSSKNSTRSVSFLIHQRPNKKFRRSRKRPHGGGGIRNKSPRQG